MSDDKITHQKISDVQSWINEMNTMISSLLNTGRINSEAGHRLRMAKAHLEIIRELVSLSRYGVNP